MQSSSIQVFLKNYYLIIIIFIKLLFPNEKHLHIFTFIMILVLFKKVEILNFYSNSVL